jgi:hypothetical protein
VAAEIICDGCGKRAKMILGATGNWFKPGDWYERTQFVEEPDGRLGRPIRNWSVCSRECIEKVRKETGDNTPIAPF